MKRNPHRSTNPLIAKVQQLFSRDLALENDYLRQENRILRRKLGSRVPLTEAERRVLVKYGLRIKERLAEVISIAKPDTLLAWNRRQKQEKWTFDKPAKGPGRPRKSADTEVLIVRLAEENGSWGYKRLCGELKKLGHQACPSYVREVLRRHGLPPAPNRKGRSWKQFLQAHLEVTWAADFFTEEVWTMGGLVTFYVLFFIHLGSRRVWIAGATPQPQAPWMAQQARNFSMLVRGLDAALSLSGPRPGLQFRRSGRCIENRPTPHSQDPAARPALQRLRGTARTRNTGDPRPDDALGGVPLAPSLA